jgi:hypothetical protein
MRPTCPACKAPTFAHCTGPACPWGWCKKCDTDRDVAGHTTSHRSTTT